MFFVWPPSTGSVAASRPRLHRSPHTTGKAGVTEDGGTMNELQELVLRRLEDLGGPDGPMSLRDAAARSQGLVSYETIRKIIRGKHTGRIEPDSAEGLARALQVPVAKIYEAARQPQPQTRWVMPPRLDRLDLAQRSLVEDVAGALLDAYEKGRRADQ